MNTRKIVHDMVDRLPDKDLITAIRVINGLLLTDELTIILENAPADDEPFDPADLDGVDDDGPSVPHEEVMRQFRD